MHTRFPKQSRRLKCSEHPILNANERADHLSTKLPLPFIKQCKTGSAAESQSFPKNKLLDSCLLIIIVACLELVVDAALWQRPMTAPSPSQTCPRTHSNRRRRKNKSNGSLVAAVAKSERTVCKTNLIRWRALFAEVSEMSSQEH